MLNDIQQSKVSCVQTSEKMLSTQGIGLRAYVSLRGVTARSQIIASLALCSFVQQAVVSV